jgi:catechol 2,3-dioxygenase-like lactoylglutathione lyase family enzyme
MTRVIAFDHIVLRSPDIDRSLRFYAEALGLEVLREQEWRAGEVRFPSVRVSADTILDFFPQDTPAGAEPAQRLDHYCMVVPPGELEAVLAQVRAFGIEPGPVLSRWGARGRGSSSYLTSPEGVTLELREYPV